MQDILLRILNRIWKVIIGLSLGVVFSYIIDRIFDIFENKHS